MSDLHRPKKIYNVLVWGGWYGSRNIGDTAILLGIKELYSKINPEMHYYLSYLSTDIDYTNTNGVSGKRALLKSDYLKPWNWIKLINIFREADMVIISGGTPIFDYSHAIRTLYFLLPIVLRKPFILFGAGVKPINSTYGKWYIPKTLKHAQYISTRDDGSAKILKGLGLDKTNKTADSAFFAPPCEESVLQELLVKYSIKKTDKLLVVAPRLMSDDKKRLYLDEDMDSEVINNTPKKIAKTIDAMSGKFDKVVFMAMHYYGPDSDVSLIREITKLTKSKNIVLIEEELRPKTGIALLKRAQIVLAMRLHALLLSASMYTPIVGIAYEQKVKDLFTRLELDEYVVDLFDFSEDDLTNALSNALLNSSKINKHLEKRVTQLRTMIIKDAKRVLKITEEYSD